MPRARICRIKSLEIRMEHRLAAAERHDRGAEAGEVIDPPSQDAGWYGRRHLVVLVAVSAVDVAAPDRNDLHEQGMRGVRQSARELAHRSGLAAGRRQNTHEIRKL